MDTKRLTAFLILIIVPTILLAGCNNSKNINKNRSESSSRFKKSEETKPPEEPQKEKNDLSKDEEKVLEGEAKKAAANYYKDYTPSDKSNHWDKYSVYRRDTKIVSVRIITKENYASIKKELGETHPWERNLSRYHKERWDWLKRYSIIVRAEGVVGVVYDIGMWAKYNEEDGWEKDNQVVLVNPNSK